MGASTGPIVAAGGLTFANGWIFNHQPPDFRVLLATGIAAAGLALLEQASPPLASGLAWLTLLTVLISRNHGQPSPAENLLKTAGM